MSTAHPSSLRQEEEVTLRERPAKGRAGSFRGAGGKGLLGVQWSRDRAHCANVRES